MSDPATIVEKDITAVTDSKVFQYVVSLQNNTARFIDFFSLFLLGISTFIFFVKELYFNEGTVGVPRIICSISILIIIFYNFYLKKKNQKKVYFRLALYLAAIAWGTMPSYVWIFIPFVIMAILEKQAKLPLEIGFSDQKIVINSLIRKHYTWADFNNIVLKDDILTLDFVNNRLLQRPTIDEDGDASEYEFNDYCQQQLNVEAS